MTVLLRVVDGRYFRYADKCLMCVVATNILFRRKIRERFAVTLQEQIRPDERNGAEHSETDSKAEATVEGKVANVTEVEDMRV